MSGSAAAMDPPPSSAQDGGLQIDCASAGPAASAAQAAVVSGSVMDLYDEICKGFADSRTLDGKIDAVKFGEVATMIAPLYDRIFGPGFVSNHLKADIINHGKGLMDASRADLRKYGTVEDLVKNLVAERGVEALRRDWGSGVMQCLWTKRALDFIQRFLEYTVIEHTDESLYVCATRAYEEVLKPYHGFLVSTIVSLAFNLAPTREKFLVALGFDRNLPKAQEKLRVFVSAARPILLQVHRILEDNNCNFPDKV